MSGANAWRGPRPRAACPICQRVIAVRRDGCLWIHGYEPARAHEYRHGAVCPGSGQPAAVVVELSDVRRRRHLRRRRRSI